MFNPARVSAASLKKSKEGAMSTGARASYTMQRGECYACTEVEDNHDRAADLT